MPRANSSPKTVFEYNPETGLFSGLNVHEDKDGYLCTFIDRKHYRLQRLVFLLEGVDIQGKLIDHIDGNRKNNKRNNLRVVNHMENGYNRKKGSNNTSGYKGITKEPNGKWRARFSAGKIRYSLGNFDSLDLAVESLNKEREKFHGEYSNEG